MANSRGPKGRNWQCQFWSKTIFDCCKQSLNRLYHPSIHPPIQDHRFLHKRGAYAKLLYIFAPILWKFQKRSGLFYVYKTGENQLFFMWTSNPYFHFILVYFTLCIIKLCPFCVFCLHILCHYYFYIYLFYFN